MKLTQNLSRVSSFLGFLSFGVLLYILLVVSMFLALSFSFSGSGESAEGLLNSFIWLMALYLLFALLVLGTGPLWGRRLIGYFTATTPGYWKIAGLAVWLPLLLSLLANALTGLLLGNASPWLQLGLLLALHAGILLLVSTFYYNSEMRKRAPSSGFST